MRTRVAGLLLDCVVQNQKESGSWMFVVGYPEVLHRIDLEEDDLDAAATEERRFEYALRAIAYLCWKKGQERGVRSSYADNIFSAKPADLQAQLTELQGLIAEKVVLCKLRRRVKKPIDPLVVRQLGELGKAVPNVVAALAVYDRKKSMSPLAMALCEMRLPPDLIVKLVSKILGVR